MNLEKSLQAIKTDLGRKEEILKALKKIYPHLSYLSETQILTYFKVDSILELNEYSKRIKESTHPHSNLSVQKNAICSCTDSKGQPKDVYHSEAFSQEEANRLSGQNKLQLSVYICPDGSGWHLTKR